MRDFMVILIIIVSVALYVTGITYISKWMDISSIEVYRNVIILSALLGLFLAFMYLRTPHVKEELSSELPLYKDIKDSLKTGDLLFFIGERSLYMHIKWWTQCPVVHCGIIFRDSKNNP